ncbi:hypothetical protein XELAEV_18029461mg [Xenopus laevis]|uniref:Uncharacterized protein n=1 Tax=Xenopus laevis TaxID=8355 RepID=A0A974CS14_XENLA|nr:hypothetical protein XELAEV_18029461mg [Xenopus laevis]
MVLVHANTLNGKCYIFMQQGGGWARYTGADIFWPTIAPLHVPAGKQFSYMFQYQLCLEQIHLKKTQVEDSEASGLWG